MAYWPRDGRQGRREKHRELWQYVLIRLPAAAVALRGCDVNVCLHASALHVIRLFLSFELKLQASLASFVFIALTVSFRVCVCVLYCSIYQLLCSCIDDFDVLALITKHFFNCLFHSFDIFNISKLAINFAFVYRIYIYCKFWWYSAISSWTIILNKLKIINIINNNIKKPGERQRGRCDADEECNQITLFLLITV